MGIWLVAEDRVQVIRADRIVSFAAAPVKPTGIDHANPVERFNSSDQIRILASIGADRNAEAPPWTSLITFKGDGKAAAKVIGELTETLEAAEQKLPYTPGGVLFVHGPLPRLNGDALKIPVWQISDQLPAKDWPTSGSYWKDPLP